MSDPKATPDAAPEGAPPPDAAPEGAPPPDAAPGWQRADLGGLRDQLVAIKELLEQAVTVGLAQDMARLDALAELDARSREDGHGAPGRRRYR